jgi:hypothetical protein
MHTVNVAATGLSALPSTAQPVACVKAMSRFLNNECVTLAALIEPVQESIRTALAHSNAEVALVAHDWCMIQSDTSNPDRLQRTHINDHGYELATAFVIDADAGQPLGPMEIRLRTANGVFATRTTPAACPSGHADELLDVMNEARARWQLNKPLVHIVDREVDSVDHYRQWFRRGHTFMVRADANRIVKVVGRDIKLAEVPEQAALNWQITRDTAGQPLALKIRGVRTTLWTAEVAVVLDRPGKKRVGRGQVVSIPGVPLPLRLVVSWALSEEGEIVAEWFLLTNAAERYSSAMLGCWYAWRWRIETYHKLLKSSGQNVERWEQQSGEAFAKRLVVASMACLSAWRLQEDPSEGAEELRGILVRLSGRQMKHRVRSTAPSLLAGLEKLLAIDDLLQQHDLVEVLALARRILPRLFRSG